MVRVSKNFLQVVRFFDLIECIFLSQGRHYDSFPDFTPSSDVTGLELKANNLQTFGPKSPKLNSKLVYCMLATLR